MKEGRGRIERRKKGKSTIRDCDIKFDVPMSEHTTFRIGGKVRQMISPHTTAALIEAVRASHEHSIDPIIIGKGSNLLVRDEYLPITIVNTTAIEDPITVSGNIVTAHSGAPLSKIAAAALDSSLEGFEFAHGIPGSLGGAILMNAGAYGSEMSGVVRRVRVLDKNDDDITLDAPECLFAYRTSLFASGGYTILSADIELKPGIKEEISARMRDLMIRRQTKQPLDMPSAGSTFKRPEGAYAAELIDKCSLRGYSSGGAMVSAKHAGFIVNTGNATCRDVLNVINYVVDTVFKMTGIILEPEVKIIG